MKRSTGFSKCMRRKIKKEKLHPSKNRLLNLRQKVTFSMAD